MDTSTTLSPTARRWAQLVTALEASDLTATAFAARHGVNPSTLSWWRSRFRGSLSSRGFVAVQLPTPTPALPPVELRVELGEGRVVVVVPPGVDLAHLREVVSVLA